MFTLKSVIICHFVCRNSICYEICYTDYLTIFSPVIYTFSVLDNHGAASRLWQPTGRLGSPVTSSDALMTSERLEAEFPGLSGTGSFHSAS